MSAAAWRIRKRVKEMYDDIDIKNPVRAQAYATALEDTLDIIDEEIEREAEHQFTRPITSTASFTVLDK